MLENACGVGHHFLAGEALAGVGVFDGFGDEEEDGGVERGQGGLGGGVEGCEGGGEVRGGGDCCGGGGGGEGDGFEEGVVVEGEVEGRGGGGSGGGGGEGQDDELGGGGLLEFCALAEDAGEGVLEAGCGRGGLEGGEGGGVVGEEGVDEGFFDEEAGLRGGDSGGGGERGEGGEVGVDEVVEGFGGLGEDLLVREVRAEPPPGRGLERGGGVEEGEREGEEEGLRREVVGGFAVDREGRDGRFGERGEGGGEGGREEEGFGEGEGRAGDVGLDERPQRGDADGEDGGGRGVGAGAEAALDVARVVVRAEEVGHVGVGGVGDAGAEEGLGRGGPEDRFEVAGADELEAVGGGRGGYFGAGDELPFVLGEGGGGGGHGGRVGGGCGGALRAAAAPLWAWWGGLRPGNRGHFAPRSRSPGDCEYGLGGGITYGVGVISEQKGGFCGGLFLLPLGAVFAGSLRWVMIVWHVSVQMQNQCEKRPGAPYRRPALPSEPPSEPPSSPRTAPRIASELPQNYPRTDRLRRRGAACLPNQGRVTRPRGGLLSLHNQTETSAIPHHRQSYLSPTVSTPITPN